MFPQQQQRAPPRPSRGPVPDEEEEGKQGRKGSDAAAPGDAALPAPISLFTVPTHKTSVAVPITVEWSSLTVVVVVLMATLLLVVLCFVAARALRFALGASSFS